MGYTKGYLKTVIIQDFLDRSHEYEHHTTRDKEMNKMLKVLDNVLEEE